MTRIKDPQSFKTAVSPSYRKNLLHFILLFVVDTNLELQSKVLNLFTNQPQRYHFNDIVNVNQFAQVNKGSNAFVVPYGTITPGFNMNLTNMIKLKSIVKDFKSSN